MQPIRRNCLREAPDTLPIPADLRHRPVGNHHLAIIYRGIRAPCAISIAYVRADVDQIVIPSRV